jgi:hypothetical protein
MDLSLNDVEQLEGRATVWYDTFARPEAADTAAAQEMDKVRQETSRAGISLVTDESLKDYEARWRQQRDRDGATEGATLEMDMKVLDQRIAQAIESASVLKSAAEQYGASTTNYLMAQLLDEQRHARALQEISGLTRRELRDRYLATRDDDESNRAFLRLVESSVLGKSTARLGLVDEPDHDVTAVSQLYQAVDERRSKRVPAWLHEARARVGKIRTVKLEFVLGHLRSGRGIASKVA